MKLPKISILGPGLIGGSLALAIRARNLAGHLSIFARNPQTADRIRATGVADDVLTDPTAIVQGAALVILCVPIGVMEDLIRQILPALPSSAIVTDVASVKGPVEEKLAPLLKDRAFWIGSHPMAGSEKTGFDAAREDLFVGATTILTPTDSTSPKAIEQVTTFWQLLGSTVLSLPPRIHDLQVAQISHLPHAVAAALIRSIHPDSLAVSGPGLRDTTRVAAGPASMWAEILLENKKALLSSLDRLQQEIVRLEALLQSGDEKKLAEWLAQAAQIRSNLHPG